jgi:hypothetical protein
MTAATRSITHAEFAHAPGERHLAQAVFTLLGCRVLDRGGTFFTAFVEPSEANFSANVFYASEVTKEQWAFEQTIRDLAGPALREFGEARRVAPQRSFHCGLQVPTVAAFDGLIDRVRAAKDSGPLAGRIAVAGLFRPGEPGALAPNMIQLFIWTDVVACGLLALGQFIEIQHHLPDRNPLTNGVTHLGVQ